MLINKRVKEERANTKIFTWFGNICLRPHLQANQTWGFHYASLLRFQVLTIDFQGVDRPLQQEIIPQSFNPTVSHTQALTNLIKKWRLQQIIFF